MTLRTVSLSASLMMLALAARDCRAEGAGFVAAGIGRSSVDDDTFSSHDTGYDTGGGYRWTVTPGGQLGAEVGYTDLGTFKPDSVSGAFAKVHGWTLGANGRFEVAPNWYVLLRAGFFRADVEAGTAFTASQSDTLNTWYAGAGFGYAFNTNISLGLSYDYHRARSHGFNPDPSLISVHTELRF